MLKECKRCGKKFEPKGPQKYCSDKCFEEHRKEYKKKHKYKITCDWCGEEKMVNNSNQRFCSTDCQYEWQRNSKEYKKIMRNNLGIKKKEGLVKDFKEKFENKFPAFKYHSEYKGADDYFKMECRRCGHVQERNAQLVRPSRNKKLTCDKCGIKHSFNKKLITLKKNIISKIVSKKKRHKRKKLNKKLKRKIKREIKALVNIKRNHRYFKECVECGKKFFTNRKNVVACSDNCKNKRENRIKETRRRKKLRENGKVNYKINIYKLMRKDKNICQICGKAVNKEDYHYNEDGHFVAGPEYPSIDHIIPVAKGGTHTWDNVQLAHRHCNSIKNDKSLFEIEDNRLKISI